MYPSGCAGYISALRSKESRWFHIKLIKLTTLRNNHFGTPQYDNHKSHRYTPFSRQQSAETPYQSRSIHPNINPHQHTHPTSQPTNNSIMCFGRSKTEKSYQQGYQQGVSQGMAANRTGGGGGFMSKLMGGSRARHQAQPATMTSSTGGMSHSGGGLMGGSSGIGGGRHTTGGVLGGSRGIGGGRHTTGGAMGSGPGFGGTSGRAGGGRFGRSSGGRSRF